MQCLLLLQMSVEVLLGTCFVLYFLVSFDFSNYLVKKERTSCFTLIMFKLSCDFQYSLPVPRGAICVSVWSVIKAITDHTHLLLE